MNRNPISPSTTFLAWRRAGQRPATVPLNPAASDGSRRLPLASTARRIASASTIAAAPPGSQRSHAGVTGAIAKSRFSPGT
ncbi:hypothetical protein WME94_06960 [Sorangium sp. So ce429]